MPDTSWNLLWIPISLCQLDSDPRSHASLLEVSEFFCQAKFRPWGIHRNWTGVRMSLNKHEFWMSIPIVTREYPPGSCCNSRKTMRLPPQRGTTPDSPALRAEQFQVPNQTRKEPWFAWWNSRVSPRTPSQVSNDTDVSKGMWNCSLYTKSTHDDAQLPCIGSRAIPRSPSYKTGGLSYFRQLQR